MCDVDEVDVDDLGDVENVGDFVYMKWKMEFDSEFLEKNLRRSFCEKRWKHRWKTTLGRHSWWIPLQGTVPLEYALHEDIDRHSKTIMFMDIVRKHPWIFLAVYFWKTLARTGGNFENSETELHDQWSHAWTKITWSTCITTIVVQSLDGIPFAIWTRIVVLAPVTQNHLSKPEDLMLQNATPFKKSAPWPPNISVCCAYHAKCIFEDLLQMSHACHRF